MTHKFKTSNKAFIYLIFLLPLPSLLFAEIKNIDDYTLEELATIKLTVGSLFEENKLYIGSSISKVTEEQWRQQGAEKTMDALMHISGIYISEYFQGIQVPSFRGFIGSEQYNSFLYLLDGIPLNNYSSASGMFSTPNFSLGNLQSIEVIRGPGSALYGADAFNGVISLNSWDSEEDRFEAWIETGSFGYQHQTTRFKHSISEIIKLTSALSLARVNDEHVNGDFHESSSGGPFRKSDISGEYDNITTSHKLTIGNIQLAGYFSRHDVEEAVGTHEQFNPGFGAFIFPGGNRTDGTSQMSAFKLSQNIDLNDDWKLESTVFHVIDERVGRFGIGTNVGEEPVSPALEWNSKDKRTGLKFITKKPFNGSQSQVVLGTSFDYIEVDKLGVAITNTSPLIAENKTRKVFGFLGQLDQRFYDDKIQVILGSRYDHYSDFGEHISPRLGLIYHPWKNSALKLLYGNAFRAPSINEQSDNGIVIGGGDDLDPEVVDTYELIWMQNGDNWHYGISAYYSEVKGSISIVTSSSKPGFIEYGNFIDATSYGLEIEGGYQYGKWHVYSNISFNKAETTAPEKSDDSFNAYPDIIYNGGLKYQPSDKFTIALNQTINKNRKTNYLGPTLQPSYRNNGSLSTLWRTDLYMSWKPKPKYEIYFNVLDIFDREDFLSDMSAIEKGRGTPGRRFTVGLKVIF